MKIDFWTSTEYGGFMNALMSKLSNEGIEANQRFNISEVTYRSARSLPQRLLLRVRQYIVYPLQLAIHLFSAVLKGNSKRPVVVATNTFFAPLLATFFNKDPMIRRKIFKSLAYKMPFRPIFTFIFLYFFKLGILDGLAGFHYSLMRSIYEYQIDLKMKELKDSKLR